MTLKELKQEGYKTISSLRKINNLINPFKDDNGKSKCKQECMIKNNVLVLTDQDIKPFKQYFLAHQPS